MSANVVDSYGIGIFSRLWKRLFLYRKDAKMTMKQLHALKSQLQQLNVELKDFKEEFFTARTKELEQMIYMRANRSHLSVYGASMLAE
jgi:hypothetical protein